MRSKRLEGQVAVITGASRGIGREIAITFAKEGARLVVTGRDQAALQETVEAIKKTGAPEPFIFALDVKNVEKINEAKLFLRQTDKRVGQIGQAARFFI